MSARVPFIGSVRRREPISAHLVRLEIECADFASTGHPDEWLAVVVPGQFQTRYYTVAAYDGPRFAIDIVIHDEGLVTSWASGDCVGDQVGLGAPKGSYSPPADAAWTVAVGDLTALPAIGRIAATSDVPLTAYVETSDRPTAYAGLDASWIEPPGSGSGLAELVRGLDWPEGPGYFWMAGESAQMREIRKWMRHDLGWPADHFDVMGYWSNARGRARSAAVVSEVDPGPIYERGKALGHTDAQIWAAYDDARATAESTEEASHR